MKTRWVHALLLLALLVSVAMPARAQGSLPEQEARTLLARLTPEERVGQLFLVTFRGTSAAPDTQIHDLIVNYHVGGVVLQAVNDNFVAAPDTVAETQRLIIDLQKAEQEGSTGVDASGATQTSAYIPLFVGIAQQGGGAPADQILSGLTSLPSQMALGASWDTALAEKTGRILGQELSTLGFNFYLGPSLDVLSASGTGLGEDAGVSVFGGDPYWVGRMGQAYIKGLHQGSDDHLAVAAKHFPGRGEADRPADTEVATVRKSLEQLKQIELAPFFAVTGKAPDPESTADALLVSHIRYQGFQGNIRATTRPVSFDQQALTLIMSLPEFFAWRTGGGVIVSDDLGSAAVRRFYDPTGRGFSAWQAARDALLAGNDLLYMGNVVSSDAADNYTTLSSTLEFFTQKYREDAAFAQRVDEAVVRVLALKIRLYPTMAYEDIVPQAGRLDSIGQSHATTFTAALEAATLINPDPADLPAVLPFKPGGSDYMIFITDTRQGAQCSTCPPVSLLPANALESAVLQLYGSASGGEILPGHVSSYSMNDVSAFMDQGLYPVDIENDLRRAGWVVISVQELTPDRPETLTLKRLLSERQELIRNKRVILFAFGAPNYLDATDISKLTAYYGMYSKSPEFVDVAARLLFQEITPTGSLPVSVPGIGYDLISITAPDPNQVIELFLELPATPETATTATPEPTPVPLYRINDTISVQTGVIFDHNHHPVPDGTVVRITLSLTDGGILQEANPVTVNGVARASFRLDKPGLLEIRAQSEPLTTSVVLQLDVSDQGSAVTVVAPTLSPTNTPEPTPFVAPTPTPENEDLFTSNGYPNTGGWLVGVFTLSLGVMLAYWLGGEFVSQRWGLRWALCVLLGGLLAYNYLALGFSGAVDLVQARGINAILQLTILGEVIGFFCGWVWSRLASKRNEQA
jgi:beta-N-acetylhexosaminidase